MSSQASSAGRDEAKVRRKLVETGAVDVMIDVRGNFFYTRTVPCQLWFLDRAKERDPERTHHVLMLDARNIYRKVSRSVCDFSPEQQKNVAAIVWLYRGRADRYLSLIEDYLAQSIAKGQAASAPLEKFDEILGKCVDLAEPFATESRDPDPLAETWEELVSTQATVFTDIMAFTEEAARRAAEWSKSGNGERRRNAVLHTLRQNLHDTGERCRNLTREINLAAKLVGRVIDTAVKELEAQKSDLWNNPEIGKARKSLESVRATAVDALGRTRYFIRQADWLHERFPDAELRNVEGLVKLVDRGEIEAHDWSLTPGRYVGVAPEEEDEDFDFDEALRSIHVDLKGLNEDAVKLAARIEKNFEEIGV